MKRCLALFLVLALTAIPLCATAQDAQVVSFYISDPVVQTGEGENAVVDLTGLALDLLVNIVSVETPVGDAKITVLNGDTEALSGIVAFDAEQVLATLTGMTSAVSVKASDIMALIPKEATASLDMSAFAGIDVQSMVAELMVPFMSMEMVDNGTGEVEFYDAQTLTAQKMGLTITKEQLAAIADVLTKYLGDAIASTGTDVDLSVLGKLSADIELAASEDGLNTRVDVVLHVEGEEGSLPIALIVYMPAENEFHSTIEINVPDSEKVALNVSLYPEESDEGITVQYLVLQGLANDVLALQCVGYAYTQDTTGYAGLQFDMGETSLMLDLAGMPSERDGMSGIDGTIALSVIGEETIGFTANAGFAVGAQENYTAPDFSSYTIVDANEMTEEFQTEFMAAAYGGIMSLASLPGVAALMGAES